MLADAPQIKRETSQLQSDGKHVSRFSSPGNLCCFLVKRREDHTRLCRMSTARAVQTAEATSSGTYAVTFVQNGRAVCARESQYLLLLACSLRKSTAMIWYRILQVAH